MPVRSKVWRPKELIALILFYLAPFNGEVTEWWWCGVGGGLLWKSRMISFVVSLKNTVVIFPVVSHLVNLWWGQGWLCHSHVITMLLSWVEAQMCVCLGLKAVITLSALPVWNAGCSSGWVMTRPAPSSAALALWQAWSPENGSCNPKKVTVCVEIAFPETFFGCCWVQDS